MIVFYIHIHNDIEYVSLEFALVVSNKYENIIQMKLVLKLMNFYSCLIYNSILTISHMTDKGDKPDLHA